MSDIHILYGNESTAFVQCDQGILYELGESLKFRVPGYQFMPAFQNKMWDGYIRLIDKRKSTIPTGLIPKLAEIATELGYDVTVDERLIPCKTFDQAEIEQFVEKLLNPEFERRRYQFDTVKHCVNERRVLLLSPTSSGKSFMFFAIIQFLFTNDLISKLLIVVPQTHLVDQLAQDFEDYSCTLSDWNASENIHKIYSGKDKNTDKPIVISTWQSIYKKRKGWFSQFDGWICDEAHLATGNSLQKVSEKLCNAKYRIGATGTLDGEKVHQLILEGSFGPVYNIVRTKELIDKGFLTDIKINCITLSYSDEFRKPKRKYHEEIEFLVDSEKRNSFLMNLAKSRKGNTLMLFSRVKNHSKPLYKQLKKICPDKHVLFIDGTNKPEEKAKIKQITETNDNVIIIASYQIFSTGVSIKNLHNIIFASPQKGRIKILQSIGRLLRKHKSKTIATVYDIVDDLRWKKRKNYGIVHFFKRVEIYAKENLKYKIHKVDL